MPIKYVPVDNKENHKLQGVFLEIAGPLIKELGIQAKELRVDQAALNVQLDIRKMANPKKWALPDVELIRVYSYAHRSQDRITDHNFSKICEGLLDLPDSEKPDLDGVSKQYFGVSNGFEKWAKGEDLPPNPATRHKILIAVEARLDACKTSLESIANIITTAVP
jgi:hypothetical protein